VVTNKIRILADNIYVKYITMTIQEWMELGYSKEVSKILVDLEESEKQYEKFAHMAFYSKHL